MGRERDRPEHYGNRWAPVYDEEHAFVVPSDDQLDFLVALAQGGPALELGIGTGRVALPLVERGVEVHGVEASPAMVERLRAKPGGQELPVAIADMAELDLPGPFVLVYVVFSTIFGLLTQERQVQCFGAVAEVLAPDGVFVVECFVPDPGRFDRGQAVRTDAVGDDEVRLVASRHDRVNQRVDSNHILLSQQGVRLLPVTVRYSWPSELDLMARIAGLRLRDRWSTWRREPFTDSSGAHISVYEPAS